MTNAERRIEPELESVPETLLWTLHHRALGGAPPRRGAARPDVRRPRRPHRLPVRRALRRDRVAPQWQALRVRAFDREVRRFLAAHPGATVVALGEGLETRFQRVDDGRVRWIGVDLPETVEVRRRLLPDQPRHHTVAASALDLADRAERRRLEALDGVGDLRVVPLPRGRAVGHGFLLAIATRLPGMRLALLAVLLARFRSA